MNSEWQPCGDYKQLNLVTISDCYLVSNIHDFSTGLAGARIFPKIDLICWYHQVLVHPPHVHKTAITTPSVLWEFLWMPFGLCNASQTFQRLMNDILQGLPYASLHIDNIHITSRTPKDHLLLLRAVARKTMA